MFFVGIDIGKRNHEAAIIDEQGKPIGKPIRFSNTKAGSEKLLQFINDYDLLPDNSMIGLAATGNYWLSVFSFLTALEFNVIPFNPIQSDTLRNFYIRKTKTIENEMSELVATQDQYLTTITGIGPVTAAVILSEVGDIHRFERPNQLLAFAGLDASVHQSGDFTGTRNKLSKRGSPYLLRAIWQAAFIASNRDPALSLYYQNLRKRGKHHGTAVGAVCRKLVNIIFAVWTKGEPYEVHINPDLKDN